jgi:acylphosphatase
VTGSAILGDLVEVGSEILQLVVAGRVQGVAFRAYTRRAAQALGLRGWVRNCPDGTVEIQVVGAAEALDAFRRQVTRGPRFSRVDGVRVGVLSEWTEPPPKEGFEII